MGNPSVNVGGVNHYSAGVLASWALCLHYGNAGIAVGATEISQWDWSPEEPIAALLTDLGPLAVEDLGLAADGAHVFGVLASRPGSWFDWYRNICDPQQRTAGQLAELKLAIRDELLRRFVDAL